MKHYNLYIAIFIAICNFFTKSTAQVNKNTNNNNRALLPTLKDCGRLIKAEFEDRTGAVNANEFPWMAKIAYGKSDNSTDAVGYHCLAVLINPRYLLAVAHCLENSGVHEAYAVLLGDLSSIAETDRVSQLITIEEMVVHPYYNARQKWNDIALLRLSRTVSYTDSVRPICLPNANVQTKEFGAEQLILAGWYLREESWDIHKLPVVVSNTVDCNRKYANVVNITHIHLCGITCYQGHQYMSGSALMDLFGNSNYYLAGLLSAGRSFCAYPEQPDIFTRIDRYLDWILQNIVE